MASTKERPGELAKMAHDFCRRLDEALFIEAGQAVESMKAKDRRGALEILLRKRWVTVTDGRLRG